MQADYKKVKDDYDNLQIEYSTLKIDSDELKKKYDKLMVEYECLKTDYSENHIIQSMNDMKDKYDRLLQTTIPSYKYNLLYEKYLNTVKYITTSSILLDYVYKQIRHLERERTFYSFEAKQCINKIESEINITRDVLEDCLDNIKL